MSLKCQIILALNSSICRSIRSHHRHHIYSATELLTFGMFQPSDCSVWTALSCEIKCQPRWPPAPLPLQQFTQLLPSSTPPSLILLPAERQLCQLVRRPSKSSHICCFTGSLRSAPGISLQPSLSRESSMKHSATQRYIYTQTRLHAFRQNEMWAYEAQVCNLPTYINQSETNEDDD